jgi:type I restriction enzyme, S subunit
MLLKNDNRPGYKKTKVGWIPDDWECVPFASVFDLKMVSLAPLPSVQYREIGVRSHGKGIFHKPPVTGESLGDKRVFHCQPGTLVFNIVFAWEQAVAVISESERGFIASHRFPMFLGRKNQASEAYYLLFFKTRRGKEQLTIASPGGAGRNKTLGQSDLEVLPVPCPPFSEQIAIAEVLECWDKVIRTLEVKIGKRRLVKQGLMQKLLSGRIRLPGFSKPWKNTRLEGLGVFSKGAGISKEELSTKGVPCIRYGEIYTVHSFVLKEFYSYINPALAAISVKIRANDLLFAGSGETAEEIGKSVAYMGEVEAYAGGDIILLSVNPVQGRADYLSYYLNTIGRRELNKLGQGQSVVHIYPKNLSKVNLALPPLEEQLAIASVLSVAIREIDALERKLALFKEQKKFLLNNLVTGTIRLPKFQDN